MDTINTVNGLLAVSFVAPLVQWIGRKIPADIPAVSFGVAFGLCYLVAVGLSAVWALPTAFPAVWPLMAVSIPLAIGTHALGKTVQKNKLPIPILGGALFAPKDQKSKNDHSS
jgi:hypothetical protein